VGQMVPGRVGGCWVGWGLVCLRRGGMPVGGAAACAGEADCCWDGLMLGAIGTEECLSAVRQHVQVRLDRCW